MNLTLYRGALPVAPRRRGVVPVAHRDVLLAALWPTGTGLLTPWATETEPSWPGGPRKHETGPSREIGTARFLLWAFNRGAVLTPRSRFTALARQVAGELGEVRHAEAGRRGVELARVGGVEDVFVVAARLAERRNGAGGPARERVDARVPQPDPVAKDGVDDRGRAVELR